jgi:hypothetical protein
VAGPVRCSVGIDVCALVLSVPTPKCSHAPCYRTTEKYEAFLDTLEMDAAAAQQVEAQARYDALQPNRPNGPNGAAPSSAIDGAIAVGDGGDGGLTLESVGLKLLSDLEGLKVAELKVICKQCGVKVSGKKADLQVGRVCNFTSKIHI